MHFPKKTFSVAALIVVLVITLLAGLKPKGYRFLNDVTWTRQGISIGNIGIAYSRDSLKWTAANSSDSGFTLEMSIEAHKFQGHGIAEILGFWDGETQGPLMIGQWKNNLLVRARDGDVKKGYWKFDADRVLKQGGKLLVHIVFSRSKAVIYVNGLRTGDSLSASASVHYPTDFIGRLLVGNSAEGNCPWSGELNGMAFYRRGFSAEEAALRFNRWNSAGRAALPLPVSPTHFFPFSEAGGNIAHDNVAPGFELQIPPVFHIIKKKVLTGPWDDFRFDKYYFADVVINFVGFIPLGFFLSLFLSVVVSTGTRRKSLLLTIAICFVISLGIELAQVYIPTRSSQLSDLILNTLGGALGGFLVKRQF
jgi:hypothetical protein